MVVSLHPHFSPPGTDTSTRIDAAANDHTHHYKLHHRTHGPITL